MRNSHKGQLAPALDRAGLEYLKAIVRQMYLLYKISLMMLFHYLRFNLQQAGF